MSSIFINGWGSVKSVWQAIAPEDSILLGWDELLSEQAKFEEAINSCSDNITLVGWSIGGLLALQAACNNVGKIDKLILISSCARMCSDENYAGVNSRDIKTMRLQIIKRTQAVMQMFAQNCFAIKDYPQNSALANEYIESSETFSPEILRSGLDYLLKTDLRKSLDKICCPTTIIHSRNDQIMPFSCAQYLNDNIKGSSLHIIEDNAHCLPITAKDEISKLLS